LSPEFLLLQRAVAGRYSLDRELGRGGMGVVFLARDVALERPVAIKLLPPALARVPGARERFLREARLAARLSHPHIVPIHAVEQHDDLAFFVMSYVDGETLGERVRRAGPLPPAALARVLREVAWALAHAHAHGVVHRDVKPENVMLERGGEGSVGRALVTDFGIAAPASDATASAGRGTPAFMSPEQARGAVLDGRSDIYSLGVTAWVAATGALPWANDGARLLAWEGTASLPRIATVAPKLPPTLAHAIDRCLACDPAARWESADALAAALDAPTAQPAAAPPVIRRFLRDAERSGGEAVTSLVGALTTVGVLGGRFGFDLFTGLVIWSVAGVLTALAALRAGQLYGAARSLRAAGYDHDALRAGVAVEDARRLEEDTAPGATERSAATLGAMAGGTGVALWIAGNDALGLPIVIFGAATAVALPTIMVSRLLQLRGFGDRMWRGLMGGSVGRSLLKVAGLGAKSPALPAPYAGEPTALALGRAVDVLWAQLPAGDRQQLGDVPTLVKKLEAQALALRDGADRDPRRAERLATTVATLEAVRLDLLRLKARELAAPGMTTTLAEAERVSAYVDEVLTPI
jgi:hypothetical protein